MKIKINTELEISEDEKYVCARFCITAKEAANHVSFYFQLETLTGFSDIIIELIKDNRLDIICTLATAYLKMTDKSVQPPSTECPDCGGTGIKSMIYPPSAICINCNGTGKI